MPGPASSREDHGGKFFRAKLQGFEEAPATSTRARGKFRVEISEDGTSMTYTLQLFRLRGSHQASPHPFRPKECEWRDCRLSLPDCNES